MVYPNRGRLESEDLEKADCLIGEDQTPLVHGEDPVC